jgi:hypothetical protein
MSLAKIELEQTASDRWHAEVEVGGLVAKRQVINAATFKQAMIAIEGAYADMMPKQPEAADMQAEAEKDAVLHAEPERKVTTSIDDRPVDVTPVPDRAVAAEHRMDSAGRERGEPSDRNFVDQHRQPAPKDDQKLAGQPERHAPRQDHQNERPQTPHRPVQNHPPKHR